MRGVRRLALLPGAAAALAAAALFGGVVSRVTPWDGAMPLENPGGGYAGGGWAALAPGGSTNGLNLCANHPNCTQLWSLHQFSQGYAYQDDYEYFTNHVVGFVGGADLPLDENALLAVSNSFVKCRANGGTCIPRFAYTWDGWGGCEPDDFETILTHIRQLGAVISQFPDVIPALECGMIGAYGEMHTSRYAAPEYANRIVGAWLEHTPASVAVLVRSPAYITRYAGMTTAEFLAAHPGPDGSAFDRIGFYNDGYLGTDYDYGTWSGPNSPSGFDRDQGRAYLAPRGLPYGGEFAGVSDEYFEQNVHLLDTNCFNLVAEWYDTHLSYLRTIRSSGMTVVKRLAARAFSAAEFDFPAMPFLGEYEGTDLRTFCEDHMGARIVVRDLRLVDRGARARLELMVEDAGFASFAWPRDVEVVLTAGDRTFAVPGTAVAARGARTVSVRFGVPTAVRDGATWRVGLRVRAPLRPFAFANAACFDAATGVNELCAAVFDGAADRRVDWQGRWLCSTARRDWTRGGAWLPEETVEARTCRRLRAEAPLASRQGSVVHARMTAGWLAELPSAATAGPVGFVCLLEAGALVPYGLVDGSWHRLSGPKLEEGEQIDVAIAVGPLSRGVREVSFAVNGADYAEAGTGRRTFAAAFAEGGPSELALLGAGEAEVQSVAWVPAGTGGALTVR
ncbi:MAG: DUF4874 domain-containing protein [Kiritimatiellia bacterium]